MKHTEYSKIHNSYQGKLIDFIKQEFPKEVMEPVWVVSEKVHGSNYSFWSDFYHQGHAYIKAGKRSGFILDDEKFFSHEQAFDRYSESVWLMSRKLKCDLVVFGELFGGYYDGVSRGKAVQKGVQYTPDNEFLAFDIARVRGETLTYVPHDEFETMCDEFNIPRVPTIFKGTLTEALSFINEFPTTIPELYGLHELKNNSCEGVVIKPIKLLFLASGERVILKNKNDKFKEINNIPKHKGQASVISEEILKVITAIRTGITDNRMDNIVSKYGEDMDFPKAMRLLLQDSVEDTCKEEYEKLEKKDRHIVHKTLDRDIANIVKRKIILKERA